MSRPSSTQSHAPVPAQRFVGVHAARNDGFDACVVVGGRRLTGGRWPSPRDAALAVDRMVLHFEIDRPLNLPAESQRLGARSPSALQDDASTLQLVLKRRRGELGGVSEIKSGHRAGGFRAGFRHETVHYGLGVWATPKAAALAFDRARLALGLAAVNFPMEAEALGAASAAELRREARRVHREGRGCSSRYEGVIWLGESRGWGSWALVDGARKVIGEFAREEDAAVARDRVQLLLHGPAASVNFPARRLAPASLEAMRRWATELYKQTTSSRYTGVQCIEQARGSRWLATITRPDRRHRTTLTLGSWDTEEQAAFAYNRAALHYYGPDAARLNRLPASAGDAAPADAFTLRGEAHRQVKESEVSRFRGVSLQKYGWIARLCREGVTYASAAFATEEQAAAAYDELALEHVGIEAAYFNFHPDTGAEICGMRIAGADVLRRKAKRSGDKAAVRRRAR